MMIQINSDSGSAMDLQAGEPYHLVMVPGMLSNIVTEVLHHTVHTKALNIGHRSGNEQLAVLAD